MASKRKSVKFDLSSENKTLNYSQCANSPMNNKIPKLTHDEPVEGNSRINTKLVSTEKRVESYFVTTQKMFNVVDQQLTKRNKSIDNTLISLKGITSEMKASYEEMESNEQTLEQLMNISMKYTKITTVNCELNIRKLDKLHNAFKTKCEEMHLEENYAKKQLTEAIINKLPAKVTADAKRSE